MISAGSGVAASLGLMSSSPSGIDAIRHRVEHRAFSSALKRAGGPQTPEERARSSAEEFVADALVKPVLKMLREQNQAAPPFAPGAYEKTFAPLMDSETATRIVRARHFPLVDSVARNLLKHPRARAPEPGVEAHAVPRAVPTDGTPGASIHAPTRPDQTQPSLGRDPSR